MYNLIYAKIAKQYTDIPIITVGGFQSRMEIENTIKNHYADFVSMCRPFICEPDLVKKFKADVGYNPPELKPEWGNETQGNYVQACMKAGVCLKNTINWKG